VIKDNTRKKNAKGILKEQYITIGYKQEKVAMRLQLRRIIFKADDGKIYEFITNNFKIKLSITVMMGQLKRLILGQVFRESLGHFPYAIIRVLVNQFNCFFFLKDSPSSSIL